MKKSYIIGIVVVIVLIVAAFFLLKKPAANDTASTNQQNTNSTTPQPTPIPPPGAIINIRSSGSTNFLTSLDGMTLYTSSKDSAGVSNCTGDCLINWPPYTVPTVTNLSLASGLTGKVSTITAANGTHQVTYNDKPLYFWIQDSKPGDKTGDGIASFSIAKP